MAKAAIIALPRGLSARRWLEFGGLFGVLGVAVVVVTLAAGPFVSVEPENGTLTGGAAVVNDAAASGGKAVKFNNPAAATLQSVTWWENKVLAAWDYDVSENLPLSQSADSWNYYNLAYAIDDLTAAYRATGKTKYLDQALVYCNNMVAKARTSSTMGGNGFHDSYKGWLSSLNGSNAEEVPLYESYAWRYVTRLLLVIKQMPALYNNATYKTQYDNLLAFSEVNMFDKWYNRGANSYIYRDYTHLAAHWAYIAMNLSFMTTDATRLAREKTVVDNINNHIPSLNNASLHGQMKASPVNASAYWWDWQFGSNVRPGSDVSHGNNVMAYLVEAHDLGVGGWTDSDMSKFIVTFDKVIWKANGGPYAAWVDGTGSDNGWFIDGWMKLGRYSVALQKRLETHDVARSDGNGALNAKLLGAPQ